MKKAMIMMAFIIGTTIANAATVSWQCLPGLKAANEDGTFSASSLNGGLAFLFYGAQNTAAIIQDIVTDKDFTGAGNLSQTLTTSTGTITKGGIGNYSNQSVTLYMVVFNAATIGDSTFFMISSDFTQAFATVNKTYNFTAAPTHMPTSWTAVPEPTSMALLALGVAAVGLRRKFRK